MIRRPRPPGRRRRRRRPRQPRTRHPPTRRSARPRRRPDRTRRRSPPRHHRTPRRRRHHGPGRGHGAPSAGGAGPRRHRRRRPRHPPGRSTPPRARPECRPAPRRRHGGVGRARPARPAPVAGTAARAGRTAGSAGPRAPRPATVRRRRGRSAGVDVRERRFPLDGRDERGNHLFGGLAVDAGLGGPGHHAELGQRRDHLTTGPAEQPGQRVHPHLLGQVVHNGYGDRPAGRLPAGESISDIQLLRPRAPSWEGGRAGARAVLFAGCAKSNPVSRSAPEGGRCRWRAQAGPAFSSGR